MLDTVLDGQLRAGVDSNALLDIRALDPDWVKQERACMLRRQGSIQSFECGGILHTSEPALQGCIKQVLVRVSLGEQRQG